MQKVENVEKKEYTFSWCACLMNAISMAVSCPSELDYVDGASTAAWSRTTERDDFAPQKCLIWLAFMINYIHDFHVTRMRGIHIHPEHRQARKNILISWDQSIPKDRSSLQSLARCLPQQ